MKKHLGWVIRLLIAAAGVGYILYTLQWSDRVYLPAGYTIGEAASGGEKGESFLILDETEDAYRLGRPPDPQGHGPDHAWIAKDKLTTDGTGPRFEPSVTTAVKAADAPLLLAGLAAFVPMVFIGSLRWTVLMRARGIGATYLRSLRLTMAGLFFNLCMPGTTGGDLMKAYYAAKGTKQRADAVVSVVIDRVCGMIGLVLLVGLLGLLSLNDPMIRKLTIGMWAGLAGLVLFATLYTSPTLRAKLRLGRLVGKVPGAGVLRKIDALVAAYRNHIKALLTAIAMSLPIHVCLATSMALAGYALGIDKPMLALLGTIPVVLMLWSMPVSGPLGLGPLEFVAVHLITASGGATTQQALLMFVAYRLYAVVIGLSGSVALFGSGAPSLSVPRMHEKDSQGETRVPGAAG